jgi:DNA modification methylase
MLDFLENQGSLEAFLKEHVKPYDPATDDYERPPFAADVISPGRSKFYNFHYYLTKVPPESIVGLIEHYTSPGDVVLDPFCGSGMTGVAVQMVNHIASGEQRYCVLNDLSPAACHITRNYTLPVSSEQLNKAFTEIRPVLEKYEREFYATSHFQPAVELYDPRRIRAGELFTSQDKQRLMDFGFNDLQSEWNVVAREEAEAELGYPVSSLSEGESISDWVRIPARILYVVWSDVYRCEGFKSIDMPTGRVNPRTGKQVTRKVRVRRGCGFEIVARGTNDKQDTDGNNAFLRCPHCNERWMKGRIPRIRVEPVEECYEYVGLRASRSGLTMRMIQGKRPISVEQKKRIQSYNNHEYAIKFPDFELNKAHPRYRRDSLAGKNVNRFSDFFTKRNLLAMAALWNTIAKTESPVQLALQFCFTSQAMRCSRLRRMKGDKLGEQLSGTLHIASETVETNVFRVFTNAVTDYCSAVASANVSDSTKPFIRLGSATNLADIPDCSIDYVFSDPPFGSNIYYSGVSLLWEAWLGVFTNEALEAVIHREVDGGYKRINDYAKLMGEAFTEIYRILKPGRNATIEFNNSDGAVFQVIRDGIVAAGFEINNMLLFDKVARTFAQIRSTAGVSEVVDKDVLFNIRKPTSKVETTNAMEDLAQQVVDTVRQHLQTLPDRIKADPSKYSDDHRTTATINSMLMNTLIPRGVSVERLNLPYIERVCSRYFRKIGQRWYLRGEAVTNGNGSGLIHEEITIKDEVSAIEWLRQKIREAPMLVGELKPLWMRATGLLPAEVSQQLDLEALLRENFWKDAESNRWREPTEAEREQMNDSQTLRVLHDVERFLAGSLKRPVSDEDRCEWIEVIFKACRAVEEQEGDELPALRDFDPMAGYRMISQLFQRVMRDHVTPTVFGRAEKQERVAASKLRENVEPEKGRKKTQKDDDQLELEL